jgi:excisionase family DNA binding protein
MPASDGPRLYTLVQVAERLQISRRKVYYLLSAGQLRSVKLGSRRLVSEDALTEFIAGLENKGS